MELLKKSLTAMDALCSFNPTIFENQTCHGGSGRQLSFAAAEDL